MSISKLISPSVAMERLCISYSSLLRMIKAGKIPFVKIGKQIRIPESYFQELEETARKNVVEAKYEYAVK